MKILLRNVHLYLALAAGLVIMISCITGAIMVFEDELDQWANHNRYFIAQQDPKAERLSLHELCLTALKTTPKAKISSLKIWSAPDRTIEVALIVPEKKEGKNSPMGDKSARMKEKEDRKGEGSQKTDEHKGKGHGAKHREDKEGKKGGKASIFVYVNPYSGQVMDVYHKRESFFYTVESLHRWLLGGSNSIGKTIVGLSTLSFLIITLTGLVLWWPKNKKILLKRLKFKTDASFKRLNHDLHIVTGFYTSIFLLLIILTGLVMAFSWVSNGIFTLTGTSPESPQPPFSVYQPQQKASLEVVLNNVRQKRKNAVFYMIRMPKDSTGIYVLNVLEKGTMENKSDTYYLDQYSGAIVGKLMFTDKNGGQRFRSYMKTVHTGAVFGMPTKILAFILCLLTFSFPITGVIMWLNRIKKAKNKKAVKN